MTDQMSVCGTDWLRCHLKADCLAAQRFSADWCTGLFRVQGEEGVMREKRGGNTTTLDGHGSTGSAAVLYGRVPMTHYLSQMKVASFGCFHQSPACLGCQKFSCQQFFLHFKFKFNVWVFSYHILNGFKNVTICLVKLYINFQEVWQHETMCLNPENLLN